MASKRKISTKPSSNQRLISFRRNARLPISGCRLAIFHLRKKAYGKFEPPTLYDHVTNLIEKGKYDQHLLEDYTPEEFAVMDGFIDHWRDMNFSYAAVKQLEGKYLVQNRVSGEIFESAQFLYILIAACLFAKYPKNAP